MGANSSDTINAFGFLTNVHVLAGGVADFNQIDAAGLNQATVTGAGGGAQISSTTGTLPTKITLSASGDGAVLGTGQFCVIGSATGLQILAGTGQDSVALYQGGGVVQANSGTLTLSVNDWVDQAVTTIDGASGVVSSTKGFGNILFLGGSGAANLGGTYNSETVSAGAGNITLQGGSTGTNFTAGPGEAVVSLTSGGGTVTMGSGQATITEAAWGKADVYIFTAGIGGGADTIAGFRTGTDTLIFNGVSVTSTLSAGSATHLVLSDGTQVTLLGVASYSAHIG